MSLDNRAGESYEAFGNHHEAEAQPVIYSLSERVNDFRREQTAQSADSKVLKDPYSNGVQVASLNGFSDAASVLGGWREMGNNIQAGKGKSVQMELGVEGSSTSTYTIPLDDIGDKKGKIITNGKEIKFVQTDGTIWNSEYQLHWTKNNNGTYNFSWK
jgi:hypothetical protein